MRPPRLVLVGSLLAVAALALTGCGGGGGGGEAAEVTNGSIDVDAEEYAFDPKDIETTAGPLEITLIEKGDEEHTLLIEGVDDFKLTVNSGSETDTGTADLEAGEYEFYCDIGNHRGQGMEGVIVVE
ncbi:MAG: cupredoxin domain-containing protein [Actinomycetota bacterium]|nr:cupredoxin domain-containing protein [Actinomycetota bacterium]